MTRKFLFVALFAMTAPLALHAQFGGSLADAAARAKAERDKTTSADTKSDGTGTEGTGTSGSSSSPSTSQPKVLTNDDVAAAKSTAPASTTSTAAPSGDVPSQIVASPVIDETAPAADATDAQKEAYWHHRITDLRYQQAEDLAALDAINQRIATLAGRVNGVLDANRLADGRVGVAAITATTPDATEYARLETERDQLRSGVALDKQKIDDLEEEARHAGALPGWLR